MRCFPKKLQVGWARSRKKTWFRVRWAIWTSLNDTVENAADDRKSKRSRWTRKSNFYTWKQFDFSLVLEAQCVLSLCCDLISSLHVAGCCSLQSMIVSWHHVVTFPLLPRRFTSSCCWAKEHAKSASFTVSWRYNRMTAESESAYIFFKDSQIALHRACIFRVDTSVASG